MRVLSYKELHAEKGIPWTYQHVWRLVRAGKFPAPIKLGEARGSRIAWIEDELDRWLQGWRGQRDAQKAMQP